MKILLIIFYVFVLSLPSISFAQIEYQVLAPLPKIGQDGTETINEAFFSIYLNQLYMLGVALCTGLAILMIVIGGVQWASSDAWSKKQEGKERIWAAVLGLLIALGSYVILNTINPDLLKTKLDFGADTQSQAITTEESPTGTIPGLPTPPQPTGTGPNSVPITPETPSVPGVQQPGESAADAILRSAQYAANANHPLNTCAAPGTNGGTRACAYAVNEIVETALGQPITNSLSTVDMNNALQSSPNFTLVPGGISQSQPGDIIISPTQGNNTGHVGIIETAGGGSIISNSSKNKKVQSNYTATTWTNYYGTQKGLPIIIYRPN